MLFYKIKYLFQIFLRFCFNESNQFVRFVLTIVGQFPTVIFPTVICCLLLKVICAYILSFLISKKMTELQSHLFLSKFSFFSYKIIYFLRVRALVFKVRGSFRCTRSEPTGCRILGEERNQNFLPMQWGRFLSKDSVYALQPRLFNSFP